MGLVADGGAWTAAPAAMADGEGRAAKRPKLLGEDVVWKPSGHDVNLIEVNGKSCTHEVGWGYASGPVQCWYPGSGAPRTLPCASRQPAVLARCFWQ